MPFKSKSQMKRFQELVKEGTMSQAEYERHLNDTPDVRNLPERANTGSTKVRKVKKAKVI